MSELFSEDWAKKYKDAWNSDSDITNTLAKVGWSSTVGFGFRDDDGPAFVMTVENGLVVSTDKVSVDDLNWDLRATKDNWVSMIEKPPGLMKLGMAYTSRKLLFLKGDYASMIKDPSLASAFVKSFALMGSIS